MPNGIRVRGSKHEVFHGRALKTPGGLMREHLMLNKHGKVVSRKQSAAGKRRGADSLKKWQFKKKESKQTDETDST